MKTPKQKPAPPGPAIHCAHDRMADVATLVGNPRNPQVHPPAQVDLLARVISHQGWRSPIVISKRSGFVVAGHGRLLAARKLGLKTVPINDQSFATEADEWAHLLADNRLSTLAETDSDLLRGLVVELKATPDFDLDLTGFDVEARAVVLDFGQPPSDVDAEPQIDKAAELQKKWGVKLGQIWELGEHRLACGDSMGKAVVERLMASEQIEAIVSDPPYGMNYTGTAGTAQDGMKNSQRRSVRAIAGDDAPFDPGFMLSLCESGDVLLWGGDWFYDKLPPGGSWIIWDKRASEAADDTPGAPFEVCWSRRKQERRFMRVPWGGWINKEKEETERWHPTQKPAAVLRGTVESAKGEIILDPFSGSGTTMIACEQLNQKCRAIEIDPGYVAVTLERFFQATGKTPRLLA